MSKAAAAIDALMEIHPKGFDLSLERITRLLEKLGNPQDRLPPVIHVAGTNGKGSTIAIIRAILEAAGLSVHVDTSPHLVQWHERYRLGQPGGGALVSDDVLTQAINRAADTNAGEPITVFEILTVVAFILFSEHPADVCLIEVGLGGRFDSTNVMQETALSVITPVDMDHEAYLGDTLAKIAFEKAGILKHKTPVVVGPQHDEAAQVIERQAAKTASRTLSYGQEFSAHQEYDRMIYQGEDALFDLPLPTLPGTHQISNAATAIAAARCFMLDHGFALTQEHIAQGLEAVSWPGRLQQLKSGKLLKSLETADELWIDGGHNPAAARTLADFLRKRQAVDNRPLMMICGMLNTKDPSGYFEELKGLSQLVLTVPIVSSDAGIPPRELADAAERAGHKAQACGSLREALDALSPSDDGNRVFICGSLYLVGDALSQNGTPPN